MRYEIFTDNSYTPLKVNVMGYSSDINVTRFGPGQRNLYIIHYVVKGKGYYNGHEVSQGNGFLIYPGMKEEYYAAADEPWEFIWIVSEDEKMKEIFNRYDARTEFNSENKIKEIQNKIIAKTGQTIDAIKMLEMFLKMLNSHTQSQDFKKHKKNHEVYLEFCVDYIQTNIHQSITVEQLQKLTGVSQPYLYKIFKDKFNMSTKQYITRAKMDKAKELLIKTEMSITEIANSVGYSDVLSFSKAFSLNEKVSPGQYRLKKG